MICIVAKAGAKKYQHNENKILSLILTGKKCLVEWVTKDHIHTSSDI